MFRSNVLKRPIWLLIILFSSLAVSLTPTAHAQNSENVAMRLGVSMDPDQFVAGLYTYAGSLTPQVHFMPYADVGLGDDIVVLTGNGDFRFDIVSLRNSPILFYISAGPTVAFWDSDHFDSEVELGASVAFGMTRIPLGATNSLNFEIRVGLGDIPDGKLMVGFWL